MKRIKTPKLTEKEVLEYAEKNNGLYLIEQTKLDTVQSQISRILMANPQISREELLGINNYDTEADIKHYDETGELPIGRLIGEDYFEVFDKNKLLLRKYELAQKRLERGENWKTKNEPTVEPEQTKEPSKETTKNTESTQNQE